MPEILDETVTSLEESGVFEDDNSDVRRPSSFLSTRLVHLSVQDVRDMQYTTNELFVFGYASLIWKPCFSSTQTFTGYIRGFSRRFNQANRVHRGTYNQVRK